MDPRTTPNPVPEPVPAPPPAPGSTPSPHEVLRAVDAAAGRAPGTLLLRGGRVVDAPGCEVRAADVLLAGRLIAAVGPDLAASAAGEAALETLDLDGAWIAPGLIDGHMHLESSLATPDAYAEALLPRGVTGVACDPHEIANVAGVPGIAWLLERARGIPFDVFVTVPSCVPSTALETAGAALGPADIEALLARDDVVGVAEIMSFPDVVAGRPEALVKAALARAAGKTAEGHAPGLGGRALQAYLAAGIESDHECTTLEEGLERLRAGAFLMIRDGSVARDLEALMPLIEPRRGDRIGFVTDDVLPHDLLDRGGVDALVRAAVSAGRDPAYAVRCATWNVARHYRLPLRGAVAPGYLADLQVVDDPDAWRTERVWKEGRLVAAGGRLVAPLPRAARADAGPVSGTVRLPALDEGSFRLEPPPSGRARVVRVLPGVLPTREEVARPRVEGGVVVADPERDLLKLACVERHGRTGGIGLGLVSGFGLRAGALAGTVGHDHHNLMAVGASDRDLLIACRRLEALGGGMVAVEGGEVRAELPLPVAGLLRDAPLAELRRELRALEAAARALGCTLPAPFMALSFLGLAVIPELRLTDHGLVRVEEARVVPLDAAGAGGAP